MASPRITTSTTFRSVIADANCLWQVREPQGRGAYLCEVIPEPEPIMVGGVAFEGEYLGTQRVFRRQEILQAVNMADALAEHARRRQEAEDRIAVGQIVHVHEHAFGAAQRHTSFIRGEVITGEKWGKTRKLIRPIGLVGDWPEPTRTGRLMYDGTVSFRTSHEVGQVHDGELMAFRTDDVWESDDYHHDRDAMSGVAPATLPVLDFIDPDVTDSDRRFAAVYTAVKAAEAALCGDGLGDPVRDLPRGDRAQAAVDILAAALAAEAQPS